MKSAGPSSLYCTSKRNVFYCQIAFKNAISFLCADNVVNLACNVFFTNFTLQYTLSFQRYASVIHRFLSMDLLCSFYIVIFSCIMYEIYFKQHELHKF